MDFLSFLKGDKRLNECGGGYSGGYGGCGSVPAPRSSSWGCGGGTHPAGSNVEYVYRKETMGIKEFKEKVKAFEKKIGRRLTKEEVAALKDFVS